MSDAAPITVTLTPAATASCGFCLLTWLPGVGFVHMVTCPLIHIPPTGDAHAK